MLERTRRELGAHQPIEEPRQRAGGLHQATHCREPRQRAVSAPGVAPGSAEVPRLEQRRGHTKRNQEMSRGPHQATHRKKARQRSQAAPGRTGRELRPAPGDALGSVPGEAPVRASRAALGPAPSEPGREVGRCATLSCQVTSVHATNSSVFTVVITRGIKSLEYDQPLIHACQADLDTF
jgi:hypothetical protein